MLNIVIPMAGRGSRFAKAGYKDPKPMIPVHGKPMIQVVVENMAPKRPHRFIFICQNDHIKEYGLSEFLKGMAENVEIVGIDGITEGQVCTVLEAAHLIDNDDPVFTINSDQYIEFDIDDYLDKFFNSGVDGDIMTMKVDIAEEDGTRWSYARTDENGYVVETAEKKAISDDATAGLYTFLHGSDLVKYAKQMIADDVRVNNEFYTCPVYNYMIKDGKKVTIYNNGSFREGFHGIGTPVDLENFLKNPVSEQVK